MWSRPLKSSLEVPIPVYCRGRRKNHRNSYILKQGKRKKCLRQCSHLRSVRLHCYRTFALSKILFTYLVNLSFPQSCPPPRKKLQPVRAGNSDNNVWFLQDYNLSSWKSSRKITRAKTASTTHTERTSLCCLWLNQFWTLRWHWNQRWVCYDFIVIT